MNQRNKVRKTGANVISLADARAARAHPTRLAVWLAHKLGAEVISERPGHLVVMLPDDHAVDVSVREVNVFHQEAEAYVRIGESIPDHVIRDMERWDLEHGRH